MSPEKFCGDKTFTLPLTDNLCLRVRAKRHNEKGHQEAMRGWKRIGHLLGEGRWVVLFGVGVFVIYFLSLQLRRVAQLGAYAFDLGIFQQAVWLMAQGKEPFVTVRGMNILSDHFTPILFVFVPFYYLWAHPFWLLLGQTLAVALGAFPVYRMAKRHCPYPIWVAPCLALGYLLHPALFTMLLFDFHPVILAVPFLLWATDAADEGRPMPFAVASLLALMCKEEIALNIAGLSLYAFLVRRHRWGLFGVIGSFLWFFGALQIMKALSGVERSAYFAFYAQWGETPREIVWNLLRHPIVTLKALLLCEGHATAAGVYPLLLLVPFGFFPLWGAELLVFGIPSYALIALSERLTFRDLGFQYAAPLVPWLISASVLGWKRLLEWGDDFPSALSHRWRRIVGLAWITCVLFSATRYGPPVIQRFMGDMLPRKEAQAIRAFLAHHVPPDASITAPTTFVPLFAHRQKVFLFPNPFQSVAWGPSVEALKQQIEARAKPLPQKEFHRRMQQRPVDFIVLKARTNVWPLGQRGYDEAAVNVLTCPDYGIVARFKDLLVLRRGADFRDGLKKLGIDASLKEKVLKEAVAAAWERLKSGKF